MTSKTRIQRKYDHRFCELVRSTADIGHTNQRGVPRSTPHVCRRVAFLVVGELGPDVAKNATRANVVALLGKRKQILRRPIVIDRHMQVRTGREQTRIPGGSADLGQCTVIRQRMTDESVPPVM